MNVNWKSYQPNEEAEQTNKKFLTSCRLEMKKWKQEGCWETRNQVDQICLREIVCLASSLIFCGPILIYLFLKLWNLPKSILAQTKRNMTLNKGLYIIWQKFLFVSLMLWMPNSTSTYLMTLKLQIHVWAFPSRKH